MSKSVFLQKRLFGKVATCLVLMVLGNVLVINVYQQHAYITSGPSIYHDDTLLSHHVDDVSVKATRNVTMTSQGVNLSEKIDWNNYALMGLDLHRRGPGEGGQALNLDLSVEDRKREKSLYDQYQFNAMVSSRISFQRSIGDLRDPMCRTAKFSRHIPANSVSIVIPFYNEHSSTIHRTVSSIVNRTPTKLIREIILVDDFSSSPELKEPLDEFIKNHALDTVRIIRNQRRMGLISSRMAGADASSGRFLVFLDSHVEINYNFLPPLIEPLLVDSKTVACPVVDNINRYNLGIVKIEYERNAFDWNLQNKHFRIFPEDARNLPAPFATPVMMGGAFAIVRTWWETIGKYDPGLEVWGGEQYEISFKIWMCGGKIVNVPCSRVAHLFKHKLPYPVGEKYSRNLRRVVSVWMDEYREHVYRRLPGVRNANPGDLSSRIALRRTLQCHNFDWYMHNVAQDVLYNFPAIEPPILAWGALTPKYHRGRCVKFSPQDQNNDFVFVDKCQRDVNDFKFELSWRKTIKERNGIRCFETRRKEDVSVHYVKLNATVQQFVWNRPKGWIVSVSSGLCLYYDRPRTRVDMRPCGNQPSFSWSFDHYTPDLVDAEWKKYRMSKQQTSVVS